MTRFVVDAGAVLQIAAEQIEVPDGHELLAPTLVRSQTLALTYEAVRRGELADDVARERLAAVGRLKLRLLGDAVLRRRAWEVAEQLGWPTTYDAEYIALTLLQADALVTVDDALRRAVAGVVERASVDDLRRAS